MISPKVSIIIPVYNVEKYLEQCLDSIINQNLKNIEIICINDGSTDNSLKILKKYAKKDNRIIILSQTNLGAGAARNRGLAVAKGEYLSFLDADDFFYENMLSEAVHKLETSQSDIAVFEVDLYDNKIQKIIPDTWVVKKDKIPSQNPFCYKDCLDYIFTCSHTCAWNKLFKADFIKKHKLVFQEIHNTNDLYFVCMALSLASKIIYISNPLMCYRINLSTSLSQTGSRSKYPDDANIAFNLLKESLIKYNLYNILKRAYDNLCLGVYYYNLSKLQSIDYLKYLTKLKIIWIPELKINTKDKKYFFYKHIAEFYNWINNIELFSFDIFDTLITRSVAEPKGIFMIMQQKLKEKDFDKIPFILKSNFIDIRISTEKFMYQRICSNEKKDIDIYEIYKLIGLNYELTEEQIKVLIKLELETEEENILPIKNNIEIVKNLVKNHQRVILISDMYLKEPMIRKLLCSVDNVFANLPLYVSCEFNAKKNTGDLYKKVQVIENINCENWVHYGDNYNGDYKKAIEQGVKAKLYNAESLTPYETWLINSNKNNIQYQKTIGLTKYLRTLNQNSDIKNIGLSFGGPILFPYVNWIVEEANKKGIKNLYFVARDGYILKKIADTIITERNYSIITSYIYGSRVAWRDPVQNNDKEKIMMLTEYLKQNIDFTKKFAFVEYAGTGETQDCLVKVMNSIEYDKNNFMGSYYLYHSRNIESQYSKKYSMLRLNDMFTSGIELLVRAPHGQTLGYEDKNGKIEPLLDENEGKALIKYGYREYIAGVEDYAKEMMNIIKKDNCLDVYDYSIIINYIEYLKTSLRDEKLIDFLGGIPFALDGVTCEVSEYAPRLTEKDVNLIRLNQTKSIKTNNLKWSEIRSSDTIKKLIGVNYKNIHSEKDKELKLQRELNALRNSRSFKIGRMITFLPRKIRGGIKCYKDHGFKYTFNRVLVHLHLKK